MAKTYVMINCDLGSEKEIITSLRKIVGVKVVQEYINWSTFLALC